MFKQKEQNADSKLSSVAMQSQPKASHFYQPATLQDNRQLIVDISALSNSIQLKCQKCESDEEITQRQTISEKTSIQRIQTQPLDSQDMIIQRVPCAETDHDTSAEHVAIENEFSARTGAAKEYEIPRGSVLTYDDGRHRTGYADLADTAGKRIYDIKRAAEGYPEAQLAQYIASANTYCGGGWGRGGAYGGLRVIPFNHEQNIHAYQDGPGVISYLKVAKDQPKISTFFAKEERKRRDDDGDESDFERDMDWRADKQMTALMEAAGMYNEDGTVKV